MARHKKDGLDYFPKDTSFYHDRRIRALMGRFGCDGVCLYDYIICEAYREHGYYAAVDGSFKDIAAADLKMSPEKIGLILDYLLNESMLLDGTLFKAVKVLTSHGIQTQWQEIKKTSKRTIDVDGKLWLLNEAETEGFIQVRSFEDFSGKNEDKSKKNDDYSGKNDAKESKGKESKGKEREGGHVSVRKTEESGESSAVSAYLSRVNPAASYMSIQEMLAYERQFGAEICLRAIDIALDEKIPKWSYIKGILQRWSEEGVKCLADINVLEANHQKEKGFRGKGKPGAGATAPQPGKILGIEKREKTDREEMKKYLEQLNSEGGRDGRT